jgi:glucose-6-phosphate dehydrogenase assembly protein OpcA
VLEHDWHDADAAVVDAGVSVAVFGESASRYGVEQIVIRTASSDASLLSIVRRFTRGDLPTALWWTHDLSRVAPPPALLDTSRQLLFDSRSWHEVPAAVRALAPLVADDRIDLADVNWRRLAPVGRALADAATTIDGNISGAHVQMTHRPGEAALAWLLAGCIASTLAWKADAPWPSIREAEQDERLTLTIDTGASRLHLAMNDHRVIVERPGIAAQVSAVPRPDEAEAIAAELRSLSRDRSFHDALGALVARIVQS